MRRLLQSIIYNRKLYDRPHDEWTCGRAAEGCPCIYGPGAKGECRATSQCLPARNGDRWVCTRAISLGGACEAGPQPDGACGCPIQPCRPVRSLRSLRGSVTRLAVSFALGLAILALWGRMGTAWSNPGPLTTRHAVSAQHCAACHVETPPPALTAAARAERMRQHDRLCLNCHDLGANAEEPHGAPRSLLLALAGRPPPTEGKPPLGLLAAKAVGPPAELACAACHREHQGADFDLRHMADQQCQVCHQTQFQGFAQGHPEFTDYPYARRTRLQFNHVAHFQKHFSDPRLAAPGPTSCAHCHEPAPDGTKMLVRGFAPACAACHQAEIEGGDRAGAKGLVFLRLPAIDVAALAAAGHDVGAWPADAEGGFTPFMRWLLEGDETARGALASLGDLSLADLRKATPAQKAAAGQLLWSVKGLFADLVTQGQQVIVKRLGTDPTTTGRTGQFSADVALAAQQAWLPDLLAEVAAHRRGDKVLRTLPVDTGIAVGGPTPAAAASDDLLSDDLLAPPPPVTAAPAVAARAAASAPPAALELGDSEARVATGGWYKQDDTYSLHYRPVGHEDSFLAAWLEGTAGSPEPGARRIFNQLAAAEAPGACLKCHSVDHTAAATTVNWRTARPQPDVHPFTRFQHAAHFSLMGDQGCMTCHTFNVGADYAGAFGANRNPAVFRSNFSRLQKSTCAACHQPAKSGESCLQCHNYHTGEMKPLRLQAAELPAAHRP